MRKQLIHKIFSLKSTSIIGRLTGSLYTLTIILTLALSSCGVDLDSDDGIKIVAAGYSHTVALKNDGALWAWGDNGKGQLGDGTSVTDRNIPVRVKGENGIGYLEGVIAVTAGSYHTVAAKNDGTVWAWGNNGNGQLGDGTSVTNRNLPVRVIQEKGAGGNPDVPLEGVIAVAAGGEHTVALKADGTLWAWGYNSSGQLGDGTSVTNRNLPVRVIQKKGAGGNPDVPLKGVIAVVAGRDCTVAIKDDGLWAWGENNMGQLGNGTTEDKNTPVRVLQGVSVNLNGSTYLEGVIAVAAGGEHTVALKADGSLWAWGWNYYGQLGNGTTEDKNTPVRVGTDTNWASVSVGNFHTIASKRDGTLWAWGDNTYGQLGLDTFGTLEKNPVRLGQAADLVKVSAGNYHSTALRRSGILWTWGLNDNGQLGDGTNIDRNIPGLVKWD